jgi:hypothetical protein
MQEIACAWTWNGVCISSVLFVVCIVCCMFVVDFCVLYQHFMCQRARAVQGGRLKFYCVRTRGFKSHRWHHPFLFHSFSLLHPYINVNHTDDMIWPHTNTRDLIQFNNRTTYTRNMTQTKLTNKTLCHTHSYCRLRYFMKHTNHSTVLTGFGHWGVLISTSFGAHSYGCRATRMK